MAPASLAKLMTMAVTFDGASRGAEVSLDDTFQRERERVAAGRGHLGRYYHVRRRGLGHRAYEDLIRGVIVQSGNDAAITIAEGIAGTRRRLPSA